MSTVEEAYNAVASCRYPRPKSAPAFEPEGQRGDAPLAAARYWGLTQQEYYARADVWPLNPQGELLVIVMCEEVKAIDNLPQILSEVQGIGVVLIGEGDLSQNLGYPRQYDHPAVVEAMTAIRRICKEHDVPCGHPHVESHNMEKVLAEGYRFLMTAPVRLLRRARRVPEGSSDGRGQASGNGSRSPPRLHRGEAVTDPPGRAGDRRAPLDQTPRRPPLDPSAR